MKITETFKQMKQKLEVVNIECYIDLIKAY